MTEKSNTKMIAKAFSQHTQSTKPAVKKMISTLMSVCTALTKPKSEFGLEQWKDIEFRKPKLNDRTISESWRS